MPTFKIKRRAPNNPHLIDKSVCLSFNPSVLGLGDITQDARPVTAIAAFFDLQGFTILNSQIEPHLTMPGFLSEFLDWIFSEIRKETIRVNRGLTVVLWHDLPFFVKFMGDGLLVMWDADAMGHVAQHNLITSLDNICDKYVEIFVPRMRKKIVGTPMRLRCGIAKGTVFTVGNGEDYVGSCINIAARLQKFHGLGIAFARRGFDPEAYMNKKSLRHWKLMAAPIRGIGENELIYVLKTEFENLSYTDRKHFRDP